MSEPAASRTSAPAAEDVCEHCGERNPPGTQFCVSCHAYLGWDAVPKPRPASEQLVETSVLPRIRVPADPPAEASPAGPATPTQPTEVRFRATTESDTVVVPATGEPVAVTVRVANTSTIVDGYAAQVVGAPDWLRGAGEPVHLLPGGEGLLTVTLRAEADTMVPAQELRAVLRVHSLSRPADGLDLAVAVSVPVVDVAVRLRAEPQLLRVRDVEVAECTLTADNGGSNRPVRLTFTGADPELAVRFTFDPPVLQLAPGGTGTVRMTTAAPGPEPGRELSRTLTVTAAEGPRTAQTTVTLQQATSVVVEDPPVALEVEPSVLRVYDTTVGEAQVLVDNRAGAGEAEVQLRARDPERVVWSTWSPATVRVPPGETRRARVRLEAPLPDPGTEASRVVTISAVDGTKTSTATVTLVQIASASPMATLGARLEPSVIRVRDADSATVQVVLDNRRGRSAVRLWLEGRDPERAIGFTFSPAGVDLAAGQAVTVTLRLDAWRPPPGEEATRPFTVVVGDGRTSVEATGSLVQASSRAAMELLTLRLDPSRLRLDTRRRGRFRAVLDNRNGVEPVRVSLTGDDPENAVRFTFTPSVLEVPAGRAATATAVVSAPRAPSRQEIHRPFSVTASDGRTEVSAEGGIDQSGADLLPWWRVLLTLLGGFGMAVGALLPWRRQLQGVDFDVDLFAQLFGSAVDLLGFEQVVSVGLAVIVLAALAVFGLTGRTGRLTRWTALLAAVLVVGVFVAIAVAGRDPEPAFGAVIAILGCVSAYVGGLLIRR